MFPMFLRHGKRVIVGVDAGKASRRRKPVVLVHQQERDHRHLLAAILQDGLDLRGVCLLKHVSLSLDRERGAWRDRAATSPAYPSCRPKPQANGWSSCAKWFPGSVVWRSWAISAIRR